MSEEYPNLEPNYSKVNDISKRKLYKLYWKDEKTIKEIAKKYNAGERTVSRYLKKHGIPRRPNGMGNVRYVLWQRNKQFWYEQYWEQENTIRELEDKLGVDHQFVSRVMRTKGVPRDTDTSIRWKDKEAGVLEKYKWPDDHPREDPSSESEPTGTMPEDPSPNDYLAETPLYRDKDRLYQLYWGYGLTKEAILARCDCTHKTLNKYFREFGIPRREFHRHTDWEPHHGIPPKYEWDEHDVPRAAIEEPTTNVEWEKAGGD